MKIFCKHQTALGCALLLSFTLWVSPSAQTGFSKPRESQSWPPTREGLCP